MQRHVPMTGFRAGLRAVVVIVELTVDGWAQYVNMTVRLLVEDSAGNKSSTTSRTIRLYPNSECGYGF